MAAPLRELNFGCEELHLIVPTGSTPPFTYMFESISLLVTRITERMAAPLRELSFGCEELH